MTFNECYGQWRRWLPGMLGLLPALLLAQPAPAPSAPPITAPEEDLLEVIGFVIAERGQLNVGYNDEELEAVLKGVRRYAKGEPRPDNFEALIPQAQRLYFERVREFRAKQVTANRAASAEFLARLDESGAVATTESGLRYEILQAGTGEKPTLGDTVVVNYRGTRIDGTRFDSGEGSSFPLQSRGGLIEGFKEGLQLIGKGGEIKLYIPPDLAYGDNAPPGGVIQAGDTLIFEVKLLDIKESPPAPQLPTMPPNLRPPGPPPSGPPPGPPPPPPTNLPNPPTLPGSR
jgi:FKBP-type peptidyl-prolyl cis-trans isomerase